MVRPKDSGRSTACMVTRAAATKVDAEKMPAPATQPQLALANAAFT